MRRQLNVRARSTIIALGLAGAALWFVTRKRASLTLESLDGSDLYEPEPTVLEKAGAIAASVGEAIVSLVTPLGIRHNNPGNIEWIEDPARRWRGMVTRYGPGGRFGGFDTPANGIRAIGGELKASFRKGQTTVREIINEWAPPVENNTSAYVAQVAKAIGVGADDTVSTNAIPGLAAAIIKHENGQQPYNAADIAAWVYS